MKSFTLFVLGGVVGWIAGATIEFYRNFDKNIAQYLEEYENGK